MSQYVEMKKLRAKLRDNKYYYENLSKEEMIEVIDYLEDEIINTKAWLGNEIKDERARKKALEKTNSQLLWIIMGMFVFIMYLFVSLG